MFDEQLESPIQSIRCPPYTSRSSSAEKSFHGDGGIHVFPIQVRIMSRGDKSGEETVLLVVVVVEDQFDPIRSELPSLRRMHAQECKI